MSSQDNQQSQPKKKESPAPQDLKPEESTGELKVSFDKPEMGLLQGGLFVMSIPLNSKGMNRVLATGFAYTALCRLCAIYDDMERIKREHSKKTGLIIPGADAIMGGIKKLVGC